MEQYDKKEITSFKVKLEKKRYGDFLLRLGEDDLTASLFIRYCIRSYVERKNEHFISFIENFKAEVNRWNIYRVLHRQELRRERKIKQKFGLTQDEIENIFDLLEDEKEKLDF